MQQLEPKQLIRIEHPDSGQGVWYHGYNGVDTLSTLVFTHSQFEIMRARHRDTDAFPNYQYDKQLKSAIRDAGVLIDAYYFAFNSLDQLKAGFTNEEIKELIKDLGFNVLIYTVTDYYSSQFQSVFNKDSIINTENINFMFL